MGRDGLIEALDRSRTEELDELNRAHRPDRHVSLVTAWAASWLRRMARVELENPTPIAAGEVGVTWAGHATVLLRFSRLAVLVNPMLGRRLGAAHRAVQPGLTEDDLAACELVLITQPGPEYLHAGTLERVHRGATIVVPPRCAGLVSRFGFARVVELGTGSSFNLRGVEVVSSAVRHRAPACAYVLRGDGPSVFTAPPAATSPASPRSARATGPTSRSSPSAAMRRRPSGRSTSPPPTPSMPSTISARGS